jgi:L,D-transpeptidase catalytic domain
MQSAPATPTSPVRPLLLAVSATVFLLGSACGVASRRLDREPSIVAELVTSIAAVPSATPIIGAVATPTATATAVTADQAPEFGPSIEIDALAVGGSTQVRSKPSMHDGETVHTLRDRQPIVILREVRGERWVVGDQSWAMAIQNWTNLWYEVDGGYVYAGFVFIPRAGELEAFSDKAGPHWVDVDLNRQTATAMVGDRSAHVAAATTGKPGYETPSGEHVAASWGRKFNETMTSTQAAIQDPNEHYDVKNVLYTQYFDGDGDALHLNYWQPDGVFGRQRTSHGCVGLELHDAQFFWLFDGPSTRVFIHPQPERASATPTTTVTDTPASAASGTAAPRVVATSSAPSDATTTIPARTPIPAVSAPLFIPPPPPPPFPIRPQTP